MEAIDKLEISKGNLLEEIKSSGKVIGVEVSTKNRFMEVTALTVLNKNEFTKLTALMQTYISRTYKVSLMETYKRNSKTSAGMLTTIITINF